MPAIQLSALPSTPSIFTHNYKTLPCWLKPMKAPINKGEGLYAYSGLNPIVNVTTVRLRGNLGDRPKGHQAISR